MTELDLSEGDTETYSRTFTNEDVKEFAELSRDKGYHHFVSDEEGSVMLHGLLTATMPTKLGGDINFLARNMEFEFPRPAYTGDEITCEMTIESIKEKDTKYEISASFVCENENGEVVLRGESSGVVLKGYET